MKKHLLFCFFAAMTLGGVITSCSDDDKDTPTVCPIANTTFNSTNGLELTYNGEALLGKQVVFAPNVSDPTKATLTLSGEDFDLLKQMSKSNGIIFNTSGVLPGSSETKLDIDLTIEGDRIIFKGASETEFCTFSYAGEGSKGGFKLNLNEVALKEKGLVGQWNLAPKEVDDWQEIISTPLHLEWDSKEILNIELFPGVSAPMPVKDVLVLTLGMPLIDNGAKDKVSAFDMLVASFKDVRFAEDGNVTAQIVDFANGQTEPSVSPKNVAFYVVDQMPTTSERGKMRLFLNIETINKIANADKTKSRADGLDISSLLALANPYIQNGIPLVLNTTAEGKITVMLDTEFLLPILKGVVIPLLSNETLVNGLLETIKNDPELGSFVPTAEAVFKQLPAVINSTSKVEIGLNFLLNK